LESYLRIAADILGILPDGVALLGADDRIRYANATLGHLCGRSVAELEGAPIDDLLVFQPDSPERAELRTSTERSCPCR
jgi:PAS domain-containing protein